MATRTIKLGEGKEITLTLRDGTPDWAWDGLVASVAVELNERYTVQASEIVSYDGANYVIDPVKLANTKRRLNQEAFDAFKLAKDDWTERRMQKYLLELTRESADYTTHLMKVSWAQDVILNPTAWTPDDLINARAMMDVYRPSFAVLQSIRTRRDEAVASYTPPFTDVTPLYPT